jgi:hypothetical protein
MTARCDSECRPYIELHFSATLKPSRYHQLHIYKSHIPQESETNDRKPGGCGEFRYLTLVSVATAVGGAGK